MPRDNAVLHLTGACISFRNGQQSSELWLREEALIAGPHASIGCHKVIFGEHSRMAPDDRNELAASCRKVARQDDEAGECTGLLMALVHFRRTTGWKEKSLLQLAQHVNNHAKHYFLLA